MEERVRQLLAEGRVDEALVLLEEKAGRGAGEEVLLQLGELYYQKGRNIDALNKFNAVLKKNPQQAKARAYVTMINDILNFYHKDLLNP